MHNKVKLEFEANSENEGLARVAIAAFVAACNPTIEELADIKTAVSEAVTNAIIHGYDEGEGQVTVIGIRNDNDIHIEVIDYGKGIEDIEKAMTPLYTTKPELERSGMGFSFMEAFMDELKVESKLNQGTRIVMEKHLGVMTDDLADCEE